MTCIFARTMAKMAWYWMVKVNRRRSERRAELARAIPSEEEEDEVKGLVRFQDWHCSQQTCRLLMIAWREWVGWQDWYSCHPLLVSNSVKVEGCSLLCASKKSKVFCFIVNPPRNNQYYFIDGIATTVHPSLYICLYKQVIEGDFRLHYTRVHVALDTKRGNESKLKTLCAFKSWHKRNATLNSAKFY